MKVLEIGLPNGRRIEFSPPTNEMLNLRLLVEKTPSSGLSRLYTMKYAFVGGWSKLLQGQNT
jgi:hypothetical protein